MITAKFILRGVPWIIAAIFSFPTAIPAQDYDEADVTDRFSNEELTQMLAPIALYPDSMIAQILMASTYPLELVEAERWMRDNKGLKGEALVEALKDKSWDPSVKSLCNYPDILMAMSDKLDQTRKLGDAFLEQEDDVMATIQELRRRAEDQGNLKSTREQNVIVEENVIQIVPADPEVVYVPVYDPQYVYGPWWYPDYPPYYWYYPSNYSYYPGHIGFGPRYYLGFGLFSWAWFDWNVHRIHIDFNKTHRFHRHHIGRDFNRHDRHFWRHDPQHRRGVAYRDWRTSRQFGGRATQFTPRSHEMRGFPSRDLERRIRGAEPSQRTFERRGGISVPAAPDRNINQSIQRRDTPFRGVGQGNFERRAGERGGESRRSGEIRSPAQSFRPQVMQNSFQGGNISRGGGEFRGNSGTNRPQGFGIGRSGGEFRPQGGGITRSGGEFRGQSGGMRSFGGDSGRHGGGGGGMRGGGGGGRGGGGGSSGRGGGGRR